MNLKFPVWNANQNVTQTGTLGLPEFGSSVLEQQTSPVSHSIEVIYITGSLLIKMLKSK
jgi:hypothetical protein